MVESTANERHPFQPPLLPGQAAGFGSSAPDSCSTPGHVKGSLELHAPLPPLQVPKLPGKRRGLGVRKEETAHLPHPRVWQSVQEDLSPEGTSALARRGEAVHL